MEILVKTISSQKMQGAEGPKHQIYKIIKFKGQFCVLNFDVANANVANMPLLEAKVESKACLYVESEEAWEGKG